MFGKLPRGKREVANPFALMLSSSGQISPQDCVQIFIQAGDIETAVTFLLSYLQSRGDREEDADLQTKLLEMALSGAPQVKLTSFFFKKLPTFFCSLDCRRYHG